jgi:RHS repeat-associated protein
VSTLNSNVEVVEVDWFSSKTLKRNFVENKNRFNDGNEFQNAEFTDNSGLDLYDAIHRMYDPQLGRFSKIDEIAESSWELSPYHFANNNPILYNDPLGLDPEKGLTPETAKELTGVIVVGVRGLWPKTRLYYQLMDQTRGDLSRIINDGLREQMYRIDGIVKFRERVNEMTHKSDLIIWGVFSAPLIIIEAGFFIAESQLSALAADAPHILKYLSNKKYNQAIRGILKYLAKRLPVSNIKDFERLGKLLSEIEKNRDLAKDIKTMSEIKKLVETIFK